DRPQAGVVYRRFRQRLRRSRDLRRRQHRRVDSQDNSIAGRGAPAWLAVAFSRVVYREGGRDDCAFVRKGPALAMLTETAPMGQIVPQLAPLPGETILRKTQPSAFFGTGYADLLRRQGVDTVIVAGCTTSGCVRATVVDAMSHNFRTIVARDGVGDRSLAAHEANLFDMEQKYADLMDAAALVAWVNRAAAA